MKIHKKKPWKFIKNREKWRKFVKIIKMFSPKYALSYTVSQAEYGTLAASTAGWFLFDQRFCVFFFRRSGFNHTSRTDISIVDKQQQLNISFIINIGTHIDNSTMHVAYSREIRWQAHERNRRKFFTQRKYFTISKAKCFEQTFGNPSF